MNSLFKNVALARLLVVEEFAPAATVLDELAVAVDVGVEMAELPEQCALGLGVSEGPGLLMTSSFSQSFSA